MRRFNGSPGALVFKEQRLVVALSFTVQHDNIHSIFALRNPAKLAAFE